MSGEKRKSFGPESDFWNTLKGKRVVIRLRTLTPWLRAELAWVDVFTIGVKEYPNTPVRLIYKQAIESIERDTENENNTGETA